MQVALRNVFKMEYLYSDMALPVDLDYYFAKLLEVEERRKEEEKRLANNSN